MPLARILTRFPEHAGALSEELRHRGYIVEFSSPELAGKAPADLEIDFEICPELDALSRAGELAEQFHADVAVSPGVVLYQADGTTGPGPNPASEISPAAAEAAPPVPGDEMVAAEEPLRQAEAEPVIAQSAEPAAQSGTAAERASEIAARASEKSAAALQAAAVAAGEIWASARHWAREFWASARQRSQEYSERFEVRRAEMRAERQHKLLELEKRRALAQERAAELESAREAAAARLQELLRDRGALTEAQPAPPQKIAAAAASKFPGKEGVFSRGMFAAKARLPWPRTYRPQVEAVLVGVAAACLLFVVGLAVASFHTRPAISGSLNPSSNGVTVHGGRGGGVTVKAGSPGATVIPNPAPHSVPLARTQPAGKPSAAVRQRSGGSDVTIRNFPAARKPGSRASNADRVSDDVTIRHFGGPTNPPAQAAPRAELKHYSDLDN